MAFCAERDSDPLDPNVNSLMDFLSFLFYEKNLSYSSLNTARSAVSTFSLAKKVSLGSHPLVIQFMKGIFNLKPRLPRTKVTWDTGLVLKFLQSWHPSNNLSLLQLSMKVVMLCLLITGQRGQTIWSLNIQNITWGKDYVKCRIGDILKTSSSKHHQDELKFDAYPQSKALCVVHYLNKYVQRTQKLRGKEQKLFISTRPPYKGISRETLARWTKECMEKSGVNMKIFTPHSTRSASTSKAATRIMMPTILKTAGWRSSSTFAKYYKKPILDEGTNVKHLF